MSSIFGLINLDKEPIGADILSALSRTVQSRAPDGHNTWQRGNIGMGHALLSISLDDALGLQPCTLDGTSWITADADLFGRDELAHKLIAAGVHVSPDLTAPKLLLLAFSTFGEAFVQHLAGDFALAVWDERHQTLICARDHMGVRPLFYANAGGTFIFASDIDAILQHPKVSDELNDCYIADFLLFGSPIENDSTVYRNIKRLPAAHYLAVSETGIRLRRYWSPPRNELIHYSRPAEYVDHFAWLFQQSVTQRVPSRKVALELTGGMDSSSIAAVVAAHGRENGQQVTAHTYTNHGLITAEKAGHYAGIVAKSLEIPHHFYASEDYPLFVGFDAPALRTPEPFANPSLGQYFSVAKRLLDDGCRALLTGQMADSLFAGSSTYFPYLLKSGKWFRLMSDAYAHRRNTGSLSGTYLRTAVRDYAKKSARKPLWQPDMPNWLNPEFGARVHLEERWVTIWQMWNQFSDSCGQLQRPWLCQAFENYESLAIPLRVRHPFSDIRLVEFMLRMPNYMQYDKRVLREAMREILPPAIVCRPKESLPGDVIKAKMRAGLYNDRPDLGVIDDYIDPNVHSRSYEQFTTCNRENTTWSAWLINAPIALAYWMKNRTNHAGERR